MSAQDTTYEWLRQHIATLPSHTGGFITEAEVASELGISRTPVREAFLRLETEGFLQILPKKGAYVPAISDAEAETVMQARGLVEDWCARRVVVHAPQVAAEMQALLSEQRKLLNEPVAFIECDRRFHRTFVQAANNPVIANFYESLRERQVRMGLLAVAAQKDRARMVLAEHRAIVDALAGRDPDATAAAVARHLESTWSTLRSNSPGTSTSITARGART